MINTIPAGIIQDRGKGKVDTFLQQSSVGPFQNTVYLQFRVVCIFIIYKKFCLVYTALSKNYRISTLSGFSLFFFLFSITEFI